MFRFSKFATLSTLLLAVNALANQETRIYCDGLYPPGSYEEDERMRYYNECMRDYGDREDNQEQSDTFYEENSSESTEDDNSNTSYENE